MYLNLYRPAPRVVNGRPIEGLIDSVFSDLFAHGAPSGQASPTLARIDVTEKGDSYEALVEIPGVKKEDIDVKIEGNRVSITAQSKSTDELKEGERVLHTERRAVSYARTFELPLEVAEERAQASYENGVLKLVLPKKDVVQPKRLQVN
jgi:HSP20 family protein